MTSLAELGPVRATFRGTNRLIGGFAVAFAVLFVLAVAYRYWKTGDSAEIFENAPFLLWYWLGLTALTAAFVKLYVTRAHDFGLAGRNFWGFSVRFKWTDIQGWRLDRSSGVSFVVLTERHSNREMWILRDVFDSDEFQKQFRQFTDIPISETL